MIYVIGMHTVGYNQPVKKKKGNQVLRTKATNAARMRCVISRDARKGTMQEA